MENRIVYDANELIQILEGSLDRFQVFRYDQTYRQLLGEQLLRKLETWDGVIRRQKDAPLTLVVCGEFKRGKSSLINAILGEDVVTTDVTTETITTNKISYGAHKNELVLSGGKRMLLSDEELKKEKLSSLIAELGQPVTRLELKRPLEILKQVTIIDTPGLEDSSKDFSSEVEAALAQADAVIYVFSVAYPLSTREQLFIKTAIKPQKYTDLFLVGNMADILEDSNAVDRVAQMLRGRMENILPGEEPILLSALDERCRQLGEDRPCAKLEQLLADNFEDFRSRLTRLLEEKRDCVLPDRIQRMILGMVRDLRQDTGAMLQGLELDMEGVSQRMDQLQQYRQDKVQEQTQAQERVDRVTQLCHSQCLDWINELMDKMEKDTASLEKFEVEDIKKFYVLFCVQTLQEALQRCLDYGTMELYDELDLICEDFTGRVSFKAAAPVALSFSLRNKTWTKGDNVALAKNMLGIYIPLVDVAVDYVAGHMRQKQIKESRPDIVAEIRQQYTGLRTTVLQALNESFRSMNASAKEQLSAYYDEHMQTMETQLEQTAMVARQSAEQKQKIRTALEELEQLLKELEEEYAL